MEQGFGGPLRHLQQSVHGSVETDPPAVGRSEIPWQLLERGPHANLLALGGRYAEMWRLQQSGEDA